MNKNNGSACNTPGLTDSGNELLMKNNSLYQNKLQHNSRRELLESTKLSRLPERKTSKLPNPPSRLLKDIIDICPDCSAPLDFAGIRIVNDDSLKIVKILCGECFEGRFLK